MIDSSEHKRLEARDDAPMLFFLLDEAPSPGPAGATEAEDVYALLDMLPLGLALAEREQHSKHAARSQAKQEAATRR